MSLRARLVGLGNSLKDKVDAALGGSQESAASDHLDEESAAPPAPPMDEARARVVLAISPDATLDVVRAAASARARAVHPRAVAGDEAALAALDDIATAAELLEERLLPVAPAPAAPPTKGPPAPSPTRPRATARR